MATEQATYSHGHHESVVKSHAQRTVENSAAFLIPHIQKHHRILDIGCGPGSITVGFANLAPEGEVIGGDAVKEVLPQGEALAREQNLSNISFRQLDANALPFENDAFDVTFCHQVLQHVGDPVAILKEMRRVTKPGGIVAARDADYRGFILYPEMEGLEHWSQLYDKLAKANGTQPNAGRYLQHWAREAGFDPSNISFTWDVWDWQQEQAKAFGRGWIDRVLHSNFAASARKHGLATESDLQSISQTWKEWAESEYASIMLPNGQILCQA
jgi:ubiquinone/menaquinone biosynthesis C-methylase UbiE